MRPLRFFVGSSYIGKGVKMGKFTELPSPGPDNPIFSEGFVISGRPRLKGATESAQADPGEETVDDDEESKGLDGAGLDGAD
jgi:hypothetical protein